MYNDIYEESEFERYKRNSLSGESGRRKREKMTISKKTYKNNLAKIAVASALTVVLAIGGGSMIANDIKDTITINSLVYQFGSEVISPETHRTYNNQNYYYDYDDIADRIFSMDNPDLGFYLFYKNTGTKQTDKVMHETRYGSFNNYLQAHGYENAEDFSKTMEEVALLTHDINENAQAIEEIQNAHRENRKENEGTYGGK